MTERMVLMIGSGHPAYREYLLSGAADNADLWLLDNEQPSWQLPYLAGFTVANTFDPDTATAIARALAAEYAFAGVVCYHEAMILTAAVVAAALGLPGPPPAAVAACRDKPRTRELLAAHGLVQPRSLSVGVAESGRMQLEQIGLPAVVKPPALGASQGVQRIDHGWQLAEALAVAREARQTGMVNDGVVLIEEYIDGPEISIDGYFDGTDFVALFLARKSLGPAPFFEEVGHVVDSRDPLLHDAALLEVLAAAHGALGMRDALTHSEARLTADGPVIIEVNGRLGGDLIPYLAERAGGVQAGRCAVELAVGHRPVGVTTRAPGCSAIRFLYPPYACRVRSVWFDAAGCRRDAPCDVQFIPLAIAGTELRLPPEEYVARYGYLIADGDAPDQCSAALDAAMAFVRLDCDEL